VEGGFFSSSSTIMSAVSAGGGSSVTKLIARKLDKHVEAFGERLLDVPEGEVNLSNEGDVRKWLELAKNDVVSKGYVVVGGN